MVNMPKENVTSGVSTSGAVVLDKEALSMPMINQQRESCQLPSVREKYIEVLKSTGEIDKLTSEIVLDNPTTILEFGRKPAEDISRVADSVLANYDGTTINQVSTLVDALLGVMKKIDISEIDSITELAMKQAKKSFFDKLFESAEKKLEKILGKYRNVQSDIEKICSELATYEAQIKASNGDIKRLYDASIIQYKQLVKYIVAGEQAIEEVRQYKEQLERQAASGTDGQTQFDLQGVTQSLNLLEQRVADLKSAEAVALQSIPTYKIQEYSNANLARKINSAFIITIPAFKSALAQAVISKQQAMQAQGLAALDAATNELILQNSRNVVNQLKTSQQLANTSSVKAETIEQSWDIIMNGIQQYKEMEEQYRIVRAEESKRITAANERYLENLRKGSAI